MPAIIQPLRRRLVLAVLALALTAAPAAGAAAPSDLDPAFGTSAGVTQTTFSQGPSAAEDVVAMPDGKLVLVGQRQRPSGGSFVRDWVAARYTADGQPDTSFNGNGRTQPLGTSTVDTPLGLGATDGAATAGGDLVVTGQTSGSNAPLAATKVLASGGISDGTTDTAFGTSGTAAVAVPGSTRTTAEAIAVGPGGTIVVAGHAFIAGNEKVVLARFTATGAPDGTFDATDGSGDGLIVLPDSACDDVGPASSCLASSLALQLSGGVLEAIFVGGYNGGDLVGGRVWKLVPSSGSAGLALDTTWGAGGTASIPRTVVNDVQSLLVRPDGHVFAAGYLQSGPSFQCGAVRLSPLGATGVSGRVDVGGTCVVRDMAVQDDGRFLFTGESWTGNFRSGTERIALGRFTADLAADASFAPGGGIAVAPASPSVGAGLVLQGGKPVVAGAGGDTAQTFLAARFAGGDLPPAPADTGGGGGGGGGGGTTTKPAPAADPPTVRGGRSAGQPMYCDPGTWPPGTTFTYNWVATSSGDQTQHDVGTGQIHVPGDDEAGYAVSCFAVGHAPSGAVIEGRFSSNSRQVLGRTGAKVVPAVSVKMPEYRFGQDGKLCRGGWCTPEEVRQDLLRRGLLIGEFKVDDVDIAHVPAKERSKVYAGEVVYTNPHPGDTVTSSEGHPVRVVVERFMPPDPPKDERDCPLGKTVKVEGRGDYTLGELLTGLSLQEAEEWLRFFKCYRVNKRTLDQSAQHYTLDYHRRAGTFVPTVRSTHYDTVDGHRVLALEVDYPANQLGFVITPAASGATVAVDGTLTKGITNAIEVQPMTPADVGFKNAIVELRDPDGQVVDTAKTGADGRATLKAKLGGAGRYELATEIVDPTGDAIAGVQAITVKDRKGAAFTTLSGDTLSASGKPRAHAAASDTAAQDAVIAQLQRIMRANDAIPAAAWNGMSKAQLDLISEAEVLLGFAANRYETLQQVADAGLVPTIVALGSTSTLTAAPAAMTTVSAATLTAKQLTVQTVPGFKPGSGAIAATFTRDGHSVTFFPDGSWVFDLPGGNAVGGGLAIPVTVDATKVNITPLRLIGNDGAGLIGNDGAGIIGNDGASLISEDAHALITNDGGGLIGNDGAGLITNDGAGLTGLKANAIVASGAGNIVASGAGNMTTIGGGG